jgi:hypothetical protein
LIIIKILFHYFLNKRNDLYVSIFTFANEKFNFYNFLCIAYEYILYYNNNNEDGKKVDMEKFKKFIKKNLLYFPNKTSKEIENILSYNGNINNNNDNDINKNINFMDKEIYNKNKTQNIKVIFFYFLFILMLINKDSYVFFYYLSNCICFDEAKYEKKLSSFFDDLNYLNKEKKHIYFFIENSYMNSFKFSLKKPFSSYMDTLIYSEKLGKEDSIKLTTIKNPLEGKFEIILKSFDFLNFDKIINI